MLNHPRAVVRILLGSVVIAAAGPCLSVARAQDLRSCGAVNAVGIELAKPFTAQRVDDSVTRFSDGSEAHAQRIEQIARDSAGRIRFEKLSESGDTKGIPQGHHYAGESQTFLSDFSPPGTLITIFDCPKGRTIRIEPGAQIARIQEGKPGIPMDPKMQPYSFGYQVFASRKAMANMIFEDLGDAQINGVRAHGFKTTYLGTELDEAREGKPVKIFEDWVSDDLAANLLEIRTDLKKQQESRSELTLIRREEPDASLFEIPSGYTINPAPEQNTPGRRNGKPTTQP